MTTKYIKRNVSINIKTLNMCNIVYIRQTLNIKTKALDRESKIYNVDIRDKFVSKIITKSLYKIIV